MDILDNISVWTECSAKTENMWSSLGGIKLPSAYLPLFMDEKMLSTIEFPDTSEELYSYWRTIHKNTSDEWKMEKVIFGFHSREVLDKFIADSNTALEEFRHHPNKDVNEISEIIYRTVPKEIHPDIVIMMRFQDIFKSRIELTEYETEILYKSTMNVYGMYEDFERILPKKDSLKIYGLLLDCMIKLNISSVIKPYELGEMLEPEVRRCPVYMLMPDALEM
jgi:hypothetical protein